MVSRSRTGSLGGAQAAVARPELGAVPSLGASRRGRVRVRQFFDHFGGVIASGFDLGCFSIDEIDVFVVGWVQSSSIRHVALLVLGDVVG